MDTRLVALIEKRARLIAQAEYQRNELAQQIRPVETACSKVDSVVRAGQYVFARPYLAVLITLTVMIIKPARAWTWAKRGWAAWKILQKSSILWRPR